MGKIVMIVMTRGRGKERTEAIVNNAYRQVLPYIVIIPLGQQRRDCFYYQYQPYTISFTYNGNVISKHITPFTGSTAISTRNPGRSIW